MLSKKKRIASLCALTTFACSSQRPFAYDLDTSKYVRMNYDLFNKINESESGNVKILKLIKRGAPYSPIIPFAIFLAELSRRALTATGFCDNENRIVPYHKPMSCPYTSMISALYWHWMDNKQLNTLTMFLQNREEEYPALRTICKILNDLKRSEGKKYKTADLRALGYNGRFGFGNNLSCWLKTELCALRTEENPEVNIPCPVDEYWAQDQISKDKQDLTSLIKTNGIRFSIIVAVKIFGVFPHYITLNGFTKNNETTLEIWDDWSGGINFNGSVKKITMEEAQTLLSPERGTVSDIFITKNG